MPGFIHGFRQRALTFEAAVDPNWTDFNTIQLFQDHTQDILSLVSDVPSPPESKNEPAALRRFCHFVAALEEAAGGVVSEHARFVRKAAAEDGAILLDVYLPTLKPRLCAIAVQSLFDLLSSGKQRERVESRRAAQEIINKLSEFTPKATNPRHFLRAACQLNIPYIFLPENVMQFGYGKGARLFNSSLTDETPVIGSHMSKNKVTTNEFLRRAGFPVASQIKIDTIDGALRAANKLEYPVVLKPSDQDLGRGVFSRIRTPEQLQAYFPRAQKVSGNLIMENHVAGENYRVNVIRGKVVRAREQLGARVIGNGKATVAQLVQEENKNPRRGNGRLYDLSLIRLDKLTLEVLDTQDLNADSVPAKDQRIWLAHHTNASQGGISVDRTNEIHPDNADLCIRATALFGLDISGLDLIMQDISKSYRDVGGIICEVNAQPQIMRIEPLIHGDILQQYVSQEATVKVSVLPPQTIGNFRTIEEQLLDRNLNFIHVKVASDILLSLGLPVSYFDEMVFDPGVPEKDRAEIIQTFSAHKR